MSSESLEGLGLAQVCYPFYSTMTLLRILSKTDKLLGCQV